MHNQGNRGESKRMGVFIVLTALLTQPGPPDARAGASSPTLGREVAAAQPLDASRLQQAVARGMELLEGVEQPRSGEDLVPVGDIPEDATAELARRMEVSGNPQTRLRAVETLAPGANPDTITALFQALQDPAPQVREAASARLSKVDSDVLARQVLEVLDTGNAAHVYALDAQLPGLRASLEQPLLAILQDPEASTRRRRIAAYSLGRMGALDAAEPLARAVWEENDALALTSCRALAQLRSPQSTGLWPVLLEHRLPAVRGMAVDALAAYGGPEAFGALLACAQASPHARLARQAVRALTVWPLEQVAPALIDLMRANPGRAGTAAQALRALTGLQLVDAPEAWSQWYADFQAGRWPPRDSAPAQAAPPPVDIGFLEPKE